MAGTCRLTRIPCVFRLPLILNTSDVLVHATGLSALVINIVAAGRACERSFRLQSGMAGVAWALNNLLLGSPVAAALSLVSAGRTATSAIVMERSALLRLAVFIGFAGITLGVSAAGWDGWSSLVLLVASMLSTYGMFYMNGRPLRWCMLTVSLLWMQHALAHESWEQVAANAMTGMAAAYGAVRLDRPSKWPAAPLTRTA